jgi:four helix bundle protein
MKSKSYRDLIVWQKSMDLAVSVYKLSSKLPDTEKYGLRSQMQRSSSSIPMNIAEGHARKHRPHFLLHLSYAQGSLAELETQLILSTRLEMINREAIGPIWKDAQEVGKMLYSMVEKLKAKQEQSGS